MIMEFSVKLDEEKLDNLRRTNTPELLALSRPQCDIDICEPQWVRYQLFCIERQEAEFV